MKKIVTAISGITLLTLSLATLADTVVYPGSGCKTNVLDSGNSPTSPGNYMTYKILEFACGGKVLATGQDSYFSSPRDNPQGTTYSCTIFQTTSGYKTVATPGAGCSKLKIYKLDGVTTIPVAQCTWRLASSTTTTKTYRAVESNCAKKNKKVTTQYY